MTNRINFDKFQRYHWDYNQINKIYKSKSYCRINLIL